jgi:hypothetical protein
MRRIILLTGLVSILFYGFMLCSAYARDPDTIKGKEEVVTLSARCAKSSEELFKKEWPRTVVNDNNGSWSYGYTNHYNKELSKCFMLVTSTLIPKYENRNVLVQFLVDVHENKELGHFMGNTAIVKDCTLLDKSCKSQSEWMFIVKPYMNN